MYKYAKDYGGSANLAFLENDIFVTKVPLEKILLDALIPVNKENERINERVIERINERINELNKLEKEVYGLLRQSPDSTQKTIAAQLGLSEQYVRKLVKALKDKQYISRIGSNKKGFWKVN